MKDVCSVCHSSFSNTGDAVGHIRVCRIMSNFSYDDVLAIARTIHDAETTSSDQLVRNIVTLLVARHYSIVRVLR
jgi:hypothetical protein